MNVTDLPPLPEPSAGSMLRPGMPREKLYFADQMRAYGLECSRAATERAAFVCREEAVDADATGSESDRAYNRAIEHCIAAIRADLPPAKKE